MDKREIIKRLNNIAEHVAHTVGEEPFVMSLDDGIAVYEAIELLKKSETNCSEIPNNSDTISRQQAIYVASGYCHPANIATELAKLPAVQPERKTGRWLPDNTDYYRTKFICSACGESEEVPTTGFGYGTMWGYCPNCGAKMKEGEQK